MLLLHLLLLVHQQLLSLGLVVNQKLNLALQNYVELVPSVALLADIVAFFHPLDPAVLEQFQVELFRQLVFHSDQFFKGIEFLEVGQDAGQICLGAPCGRPL